MSRDLQISTASLVLKAAPNTFQLIMDKVVHGLKFKSYLCYLGDVLICSETFEQHLSDLKKKFLGDFEMLV